MKVKDLISLLQSLPEAIEVVTGGDGSTDERKYAVPVEKSSVYVKRCTKNFGKAQADIVWIDFDESSADVYQ